MTLVEKACCILCNIQDFDKSSNFQKLLKEIKIN